MIPKVVVFDLGKVLVDFDYSIAAAKIAARARAGIDAQKIFSDHASILVRYETGSIDTHSFYDEMCTATGFRGTSAEFGEFFADIFTPIHPMIELHGELRKSGLPVYIFSNTNLLAVEHIRRRFPFFSHFDGYILSYQHGAMKPDARLYEVVENQTKRSAEEILYLDDRPENIATGKVRKWQAILHESPGQTRAALEKIGLPPHA